MRKIIVLGTISVLVLWATVISFSDGKAMVKRIRVVVNSTGDGDDGNGDDGDGYKPKVTSYKKKCNCTKYKKTTTTYAATDDNDQVYLFTVTSSWSRISFINSWIDKIWSKQKPLHDEKIIEINRTYVFTYVIYVMYVCNICDVCKVWPFLVIWFKS